MARIVILGGGFAGAFCARDLQKTLGAGHDVLLLDHTDYFIFYPLLVEAGTGNLEPRHVIVPLRSFLTGKNRARFRMASLVGVDPGRQFVRYRMEGSEEVLRASYDHLVVALGSVTSLPPVPGLREFGWQVKGLADAVALRDRAIQMLELANTVEDRAKRRALLHFVVVGSNFTGVEVAGEFNEYLRAAAKRFRNIHPEDCGVTIVERGPRILSAVDADLAAYAAKALGRAGVRILTQTTTKEIRAESVILSSGESLAAHTCVWCAGIAQNPAAAALPFPKDERGFLLCEPDFRVQGHHNVWAIGDCAVNPAPDGKPYAATAQNAMRMGSHLARNLAHAIAGRRTAPFAYTPQGWLAALGCRTAVAKIFGIKLSGFPAWWLWRTAYLSKMPTLSRKVRIAMDWTLDLFFQRDYVQLGIHRRPL